MKEPAAGGRGRWIGLALGTPVMAWGVQGALGDAGDAHPGELARWILGSALVHDLLLLPAALVVGVAARRVLPEVAWPAVRWAMFTTAVLVMVSWPFVRGYGRLADNPSVLPRDYRAGLVLALLVVWGGAVVVAVRAARLPASRR